jgi:hypothetical protein
MPENLINKLTRLCIHHVYSKQEVDLKVLKDILRPRIKHVFDKGKLKQVDFVVNSNKKNDENGKKENEVYKMNMAQEI